MTITSLKKTSDFCDLRRNESIIPKLTEYINIPNQSPMFGSDWKIHGYMVQVVEQFIDWIKNQVIPKLCVEVIHLLKRTPLIFIDIPRNSENTVLLYGRLNKQPEISGWRDELAPWQPVLEGNKLYGRGGAGRG